MKNAHWMVVTVCFFMTAWAGSETLAETVVVWDFAEGLQGWEGNFHVADLTWSHRGLSFSSTGIDPWIEGPRIDLPGDRITKVTVRMRSDGNAGGELFYGPTFRAGHSVRFTVNNDGQWHDYELFIMELLGPGTRFRLDPASSTGQIGVAFIKVETLAKWEDPSYEAPTRPTGDAQRFGTVRSGSLRLVHRGTGMGDFGIELAGREMAVGYGSELIGVLWADTIEWLDLKDAASSLERAGDALVQNATISDSQGGTWEIRREVRPSDIDGVLAVDMQIRVDAQRDVLLLPWLTLFAGLDTFGAGKDQGLLAGLEYLCDEPSSSQADITTPGHVRRIPDPLKVTFPLMAIAAEGSYIGLVWEPSDLVGPVFDSPDTFFGSDAHVMGLTGPAVGARRFENNLVAHSPVRLAADEPVTARMWIIAGQGNTVVPAVEQYVQIRGLPPVPEFEGGFASAARLLAHGWVDSQLGVDGLFRHAVWQDRFKPGPAADAAMFMDWLAVSLDETDEGLIVDLMVTRDLALSNVPESRHFDGGVSHVQPPAAPLVFGDVEAFVERRYDSALSVLDRFDANGVKTYRPGDVDYGATHFADHANGYSARDLFVVMEAATLCANTELIEAGLELLDKQTLLYADTVPRGAQTWEVPLHTPDILASALLAKAYTLAYVASGRDEYLDQARYWAWTGVPFVYLVNPTEGEIGPYATIPVFGATNWVGSWFGRPVQWCGLVYASALHLLSEHDPNGPWSQIGRGITAAGLQMAWPLDDLDRQGLLPDFVLLESQHRDGPAINPGTTQAHLPELFDAGTLYDVTQSPRTGCFIHAPCAISGVSEEDGVLAFTVDGWGAGLRASPYQVLVSGWQGQYPYVTIRRLGQETDAAPQTFPVPVSHVAGSSLLLVPIEGPAQVQIAPPTQ